MKHASPAHKTAQYAKPLAQPAGPAAVALAPPAYGIDVLDRASGEPMFAQQRQAAPLIGAVQMRAGTSSAGDEVQARRENRTGLPDDLKAGIEHRSGLSLDDVRVQYNSPKPAQLHALAYTQGSEIHVAPGQERHLPHEAWHVVQQKQGRVKATAQLKGVNINDDQGLEHEASVMGVQALQRSHQHRNGLQRLPEKIDLSNAHSQLDHPTQGVLIQREVDTSSSRWLPKYEENETPAWKDDYGVPEWAKEAYRSESKITVICSMSSDGKIGSVYFGQQGRIRTTHSGGPEQKKHENLTTVQFNIDDNQATHEFQTAHPEKTYPKFYKKSQVVSKYYYRWLAEKLKGVTVDTAPAWATLVKDPETAHDLAMGNPSENSQLFEIFKQINGDLAGLHPSRGAATKFATDKQTIAVLHAAIKYINDKDLKDPKQRNVAFYEFVKSRLPNFVGYMRHPDTIKYK